MKSHTPTQSSSLTDKPSSDLHTTTAGEYKSLQDQSEQVITDANELAMSIEACNMSADSGERGKQNAGMAMAVRQSIAKLMSAHSQLTDRSLSDVDTMPHPHGMIWQTSLTKASTNAKKYLDVLRRQNSRIDNSNLDFSCGTSAEEPSLPSTWDPDCPSETTWKKGNKTSRATAVRHAGEVSERLERDLETFIKSSQAWNDKVQEASAERRSRELIDGLLKHCRPQRESLDTLLAPTKAWMDDPPW